MRRLVSCLAVLAILTSAGRTEAGPSAVPCQFAGPLGIVAASSVHDLGCSTSDPFMTAVSEQPFEHGTMLWLQEWGIVNVLREDGGYDGHDDLYSPGEPEPAGLVPPRDDLQEPTQGFGEIWRKIGGPNAAIGWATAPELSYVSTVRYFERVAVIQRADGSQLALTIFNHTRGQWALATFPTESDR